MFECVPGELDAFLLVEGLQLCVRYLPVGTGKPTADFSRMPIFLMDSDIGVVEEETNGIFKWQDQLVCRDLLDFEGVNYNLPWLRYTAFLGYSRGVI